MAVGLKETLMEQVPPIATKVPQLFVSEKSPLGVMPEMLSEAEPVLVSVTVWTPLIVPTGVPPALATKVARTDVRPSDAEEVAVAVCVPVAETALASENASVEAEVLGDARAFPYPLPAVQVPTPLSRAK